MVMRPKSRATVVVVLPSTPRRSSTPAESSVISSSVRSGVISLSAATIVVLPTPNPPAMRIFTEAARGRELSKFSDAIEYSSQNVEVSGPRVGDR